RELHPKHMAMPDRALIRCEYRMATFSVPERKSPAPKRREREISKILGEALKPAIFDYLYPRSVIDVFIEVIQADGGSRCAAVTAASLAIADAGIPMKDLVAGCAAGILDGQVVLDLDDVEDKEGDGDLPFAYLPHTGEVVLLQSDGVFTPEEYKEALDMLIPACKKIYQMQRDALTTKYSRITDEVIETLEDEAPKEKAKAPAKPKEKKAEPAKKETKKKADDKKAKDQATEKAEKKKPAKKSDKKTLVKKKTSPKEKAEKK
ncbi:MAG: exosome complex exonuclease Rrp41, partial [Asgard group archaeon]|nr:exosome complex exonuclease Rrp41 [Asgard group archaeon]